jgi:hypothetical protein
MASSDERTSATAHPWAPDPVVAELQMCPAATVTQMEELMNARKIDFLTSDTSSAARKFKEAYNSAYESPISHLPVVPTLGQSEAAPFLSPYVLKILLRKDQQSSSFKEFFSPLKGTPNTEQDAQELIEHLDDMHYTNHTILNLHSPAMDRYFEQSSTEEGVQNTTSIMPCGAILPLEYSVLVNSTSTHLLSGTQVFIFFPPSHTNMEILATYFSDHSKEYASSHTQVCKALQGGITFVQRPGQVVFIPLYCVTVVIATKTSVAVSYRWLSEQGLPLRLKYIELLCSQFLAVEPTARRYADVPMKCFITRLYEDISAVLYQEKPIKVDKVSTITALGATWKGTVKKKGVVIEQGAATQFRDLVKNYTSGELKNEILMNIPRLWNKVVQTHGLEKCPVCQERIDGLDTTFIKHFWARHWGRFENADAVEGQDARVEA